MANVALLPSPFYRMTLLLQLSFLFVAAIGAVLNRLNVGPAFLRLPHYFCTANLAALVAFGNFILQRNVVAWRTHR
jgi:hypothetical protein